MTDLAVPPEGSLEQVTVRELLEALAAGRETGLLHLHGDDDRLVALSEGEVYLATSASGPSLHHIVVGSGAAPEEAWTAAVATASGPGAAAGIAGILDDDLRVDSDRLRTVLEEHVVASAVELLAPGSERYQLIAGATHQLGTRFCFPVSTVLTEAARRLDAWRASSATLGSTTSVVRRSPALPRGSSVASLTALEWQVLGSLAEAATVAEVVARSGLSAFTVFDVLHRLVRRRLVEVTEGSAPAD